MIVIVSCAGWVVVALVSLAFTVTVIRSRRKYWTDLAYANGTLDGFRIGDARGYTRGYSQACLDHVLAAPTEAQYYAEVAATFPDANDLADAHRLGAVRRSVQGKEGSS
jgi:hypothetical protein